MPDDQFDYVVVGAGSAGAVVAARLTEDPSVSVLLLEAGGEADSDDIAIPLAFAALFKTRWDWNYTTAAQKHLNDRATYWPRMKALGGCSSMNAMIYIRGNHADYDAWDTDHGATGWSYDDVLPYFTRAEGNSSLGNRWHGTAGPLNVEDRSYNHPLVDKWIDSAVAYGIPRNDDFNGAQQDGAGRYQVTCKRGRRWSTDKAYLEPARNRPNLTVALNASARRIEFDGERATGVTFDQHGSPHTVTARREVILSGGAINTPQLLMLSGIGPSEHLAEHGVDVRVPLPAVGENLHDHPAVPVVFNTRDAPDLLEFQTMSNLLRWKAFGSGPLSSNGGEAGAFIRTRDDLEHPDMQYHVMGSGFHNNMMQDTSLRGFVCAPTLVHVASRGTVRLRSADPAWHPEIQPNYFDAPEDLDAMLVGVRKAFEMCSQGPLAAHLDKPLHLPAAPTDDDFVAHIREHTQTLYHPVGTCAMGSDESSVVDPQLRVRGTERLRVVDASVMPTVTRGNTNAPTIMIAEKAVEEIRRSA